MNKSAPYITLGRRLFELRLQAGIKKQAAAARLLDVQQQSVSRWERGASRPRATELAVIASVYQCDAQELMEAAGYSVKASSATTAFDQPFPVDALLPASFERFCQYLLAALNPDAQVHLYGGQGHKQDGLDVEVRLSDGGRQLYQCKRVKTFGPQKVREAMQAMPDFAQLKVLLMSKTASPAERQELAQNNSWQLWDREDLSRRIRQQLPPIEQTKLVDTFFPGQRMALLGRPEEVSPWQKPDEFFAPFAQPGSAFTHHWHLLGREAERQQLQRALDDPGCSAVLMMAAGGAGKTRLLKQLVEDYQQRHADHRVWFLVDRPGALLDSANMALLGDSEKPTLLVVDDAHVRIDVLRVLFDHCLRHGKVRLLLALRPYGDVAVRQQAQMLEAKRIQCCSLERLTLQDSTLLAEAALAEYQGPKAAARPLAERTRDCPLATVLGARVVARLGIDFRLAGSDAVFKQELLNRFTDVLQGSVGVSSDERALQKLLAVISLIQPFDFSESALRTIGEQVAGIKPVDLPVLLQQLLKGGVLFQRGGGYRLMPDLLADSLIEQHCIAGDASTGFADAVLDALQGSEGHDWFQRMLVNVGRLDWQQPGASKGHAHLLDHLWQRLEGMSDDDSYSGRKNALQEVAFYQPERALRLVARRLETADRLNSLPAVLRNVAYSEVHLEAACEGLWQLANIDAAADASKDNHPIKVLAGLCRFGRHKPLSYIKRAVAFCLDLARDDANLRQRHSPLDALAGALETEGHETRYEKHTIYFEPYFLSPEAVAPIRQKLIDKALQLITHEDAAIAVKAARFLSSALHYPRGQYGATTSEELIADWLKEFAQTLKAMELVLKSGQVHALAHWELLKPLGYLTQHKGEKAAVIAARILKNKPKTVAFQTLTTLVDGHGHALWTPNYQQQEKDWQDHLQSLTAALLAQHPDAADLLGYLEEQLAEIQRCLSGNSAEPHRLIFSLTTNSIPVAVALIERTMRQPENILSRWLPTALTVLLDKDRARALQFAQQLMDSGNAEFQQAVGRMYGWAHFDADGFSAADIERLERLFSSTDAKVVSAALWAIRSVCRTDAAQALRLVKGVDFNDNEVLADEVMALLARDEVLPVSTLHEMDVQQFLDKLMPLQKLEKYWVSTFIQNAYRYHPLRVVDFLQRRVERHAQAQQEHDWQYDLLPGDRYQRQMRDEQAPQPQGGTRHRPTGFVPKNADLEVSLRAKVWAWMGGGAQDGYRFQSSAAELFALLFGPFDAHLTAVLQDWLKSADTQQLKCMERLVAQAHPEFVFEQPVFIEQLLQQARQQGPKVLRDMRSALYSASVHRSKQGTPGQPFPQDVKLRDQAIAALQRTPRFSPVYELYEALKKNAEGEIKYSLERAAREDDE